ncbi:MAG: metallophosphoesterase [Gammaproteobacteria bacterium]|nr:metallophosphoesterase [Gammaproteobacteria bacterium]
MRKLLKTIFIIIIVAVLGRQLQIMLDSRIDAAAGPWLQHGQASSMRVYWHTPTASPTAATVFAADTGQVVQSVRLDGTRRSHSITFDALQAESRYEYVLQWPATTDATRHAFRTPPAGADSSVRLWLLGDPGRDGEIAQRVQAAARQWMSTHVLSTHVVPDATRSPTGQPDLLLTSGDNAYTSGRFNEYREALLQPLASELTGTSFWPAYGNHDARRRAFFKLFTFPANAESGGIASGSQRYYAFDYGPVHVVMLDSQSSLRLDKPDMLNWLQRDLQHNTLPWTIVVLHHPPYSKGSNDSDAASGSDWRQRVVREDIVPLLEQADVDLVLAGHSHSYERSHLLAGHYGSSPSLTEAMLRQRGKGPGDIYRKDSDCHTQCGTVYLVLGSSSKIDQAPLDHPAMAVATATAGSLIIDVDRDCLQANMIDQHGRSADVFVLDKTAAGSACSMPIMAAAH